MGKMGGGGSVGDGVAQSEIMVPCASKPLRCLRHRHPARRHLLDWIGLSTFSNSQPFHSLLLLRRACRVRVTFNLFALSFERIRSTPCPWACYCYLGFIQDGALLRGRVVGRFGGGWVFRRRSEHGPESRQRDHCWLPEYCGARQGSRRQRRVRPPKGWSTLW